LELAQKAQAEIRGAQGSQNQPPDFRLTCGQASIRATD